MGVIAFAVACCLAGAAPAADLVDELVRTLKEAAKDDAELAAKVLAAANEITADPPLRTRLRERAHEIGLKTAAGCVSAMKAARAEIEQVPAHRAAWEERLLAACRRWHELSPRDQSAQTGAELLDLLVRLSERRLAEQDTAAAVVLLQEAHRLAPGLRYRDEEVRAKLDAAAARKRVEDAAAELTTKLAAEPADADTRESLVRLYVAELDRPDLAAKLLGAGVGEAWRTYVPLASRKLKDLPAQACLELGDWYVMLADKASEFGRRHTLARARACYARFLSQHTGGDVLTLKAKARLQQVSAELDKLPSPASQQFLGTYKAQDGKIWVVGLDDGRHGLLMPDHTRASTKPHVKPDHAVFSYSPEPVSNAFPGGAVVSLQPGGPGEYLAEVKAAPSSMRSQIARAPSAPPQTVWRLTRLAEEPIVVFQSRDSAGNTYFPRLYANGRNNLPTSSATWALRGQRFALYWPNPRAPGGAWRDVGTAGKDGRSYKARNQVGVTITAKAVLGRLPVR